MNSPQEMLKNEKLFGMRSSTMSQASTRCSSRASDMTGPSPDYILRSPVALSDLDVMSEEDEDLLSSDDGDDKQGGFSSLQQLDERAEEMEQNQDSIDKKTERLMRLEQLMASVHELQAVDQALDALIAKVNQPRPSKTTYSKELMLQVRLGVLAAEATAPKVPAPAPKPQQPEVPAGWHRKESGKYPGRFYYVNNKTGETVWKMPKPDLSEELASIAPEEPQAVWRAPPGLSMPMTQCQNIYDNYGYGDMMHYQYMPACAMAA